MAQDMGPVKRKFVLTNHVLFHDLEFLRLADKLKIALAGAVDFLIQLLIHHCQEGKYYLSTGNVSMILSISPD
jgi:hypothetical protein